MILVNSVYILLFTIFILFSAILFYIYFAYSLTIIARKLDNKNTLLAWIPIANFFLLLQLAKKPWWWFFLILVPLVNIIIYIIIWAEIARALDKPDWLGVLIIIPIGNVLLPGILAYAAEEGKEKTNPGPFIVLGTAFLFSLAAIILGVILFSQQIQNKPPRTMSSLEKNKLKPTYISNSDILN